MPSARSSLRLRRFTLAAGLWAMAGAMQPAAAFHFPWDQGHDTTRSNDPTNPGPDDRPPCDPECNGNARGSPAYAALGHAYWRETDVVLRGRPYIGVYRAYNSADPVVGLFGNGWSVDFDIALYPANQSGTQQRIFKAANGKRFVYQRQADGSYLAPAGRFETIVETATGVTMTMQDGRRNVFALDGRLLERHDLNGNRVVLGYDTSGRPVSVGDGNGRSLAIAYNGASLVSTVADHAGRTWRYAYDATGNLVSVTDPLGGVRRYTWQTYRPAGDAFTYAQLLSITDPAGVPVVRYAYAGDQISSYSEGANTITYTRAFANTRLAGTVTRRDSLGVSTSYTYGSLGLVTREVDGVGGVTSRTYDANGRVTATTDALGRTWSSSYDTLGRLLTSSNPLGQVSVLQYVGQDPRPTGMSSPSGRAMTMVYDIRGNLLSVADPAGAATRMAYNAAGDLTLVTNALGQGSTVSYNAWGLPTSITDPLGRSGTKTYDGLGRVVQATNGAGETVRYTYDALDRVTAVQDALGQSTAFAYDAGGRLQTVADAKGFVTRFEYDAHGRRSAEVAPDGRRTTYAHRADNLLATITWPDNTTIGYQYDNNKRVVRETAGAEVTTYAYDALGRLTAASGPGGAVGFSYDAAGRMLTETSGGRTHTITRNVEGERTNLAFLGLNQAYTRDVRGQVTRMASAVGDFDFDFDGLGRRSRLAYPDGSTAIYTFDAGGRLTELRHSGAFNATYAFAFDAADRVSRVAGDGADWNYGYDALGRLTRAERGSQLYSYTLDAVGNILDDGRAYDINHRLMSDANRTYLHDQRGNLTQEQDRATGARAVYSWNVKNQLLQIQYFDGASAVTPRRTLSFTYDPLGRRSSRVDNGVTQRFVYDGKALLGVLDSAGNVLSYHVQGPSGDEPLAVVGAGRARFIHADQRGSTRAVTEGGVLIGQYRYGPYGEDLGGIPDVVFGFGGREHDGEGLYFHRARFRSVHQQRFLSADPVGLAGGFNRYRYADADPVNLADPDGTNVGIAIGIGVRVIGGRAAAAAIGAAARRALGPVAGGIAACVLAGVCSASEEAENPEAPAETPPIPDDPQQCPGPGWEWRGKQPVGGDKGAWHNPETGESLHPDLDHPEPIGPHWDYTDRNGNGWRVYPDGRKEPK